MKTMVRRAALVFGVGFAAALLSVPDSAMAQRHRGEVKGQIVTYSIYQTAAAAVIGTAPARGARDGAGTAPTARGDPSLGPGHAVHLDCVRTAQAGWTAARGRRL